MKPLSLINSMLLTGKPLIAPLAFVVWASFNFCLLEDTFAAPHSHEDQHSEHVHAEKHAEMHGHDAEEKTHEKTKPNSPSEETACCSDIIAAVQDVPRHVEKIEFSAHSIFFEENSSVIVRSPNTVRLYEIEFPPGHSPPSSYLLNSVLILAPPRVS